MTYTQHRLRAWAARILNRVRDGGGPMPSDVLIRRALMITGDIAP